MTDANEERITKVQEDLEAGEGAKPAKSSAAAPRVKDPKKVAAGKALAKRNREAREAQKKLEDIEAQMGAATAATPLTFSDADGWLMAAAGVAGGCLTLYHAYKFFFPPPEWAPSQQLAATANSGSSRPGEPYLRPKESVVTKTGEMMIDME